MNKQEFLRRFHHIRSVGAEIDFPLESQGRQAAVLIPLIEEGNQLSVLLTERAHHLKHHGGQVSFPGGKVESTDASVQHTAARETFEEIGIPQQNIQWLGNIGKYRTVTGYEITPLVGFVHPPFNIVMDENEVASVFQVPLCELCNLANHYVYPVQRMGLTQTLYFIRYQRYTIWGATAAIIRNLSYHLYDNK